MYICIVFWHIQETMEHHCLARYNTLFLLHVQDTASRNLDKTKPFKPGNIGKHDIWR